MEGQGLALILFFLGILCRYHQASSKEPQNKCLLVWIHYYLGLSPKLEWSNADLAEPSHERGYLEVPAATYAFLFWVQIIVGRFLEWGTHTHQLFLKRYIYTYLSVLKFQRTSFGVINHDSQRMKRSKNCPENHWLFAGSFMKTTNCLRFLK